MFYHGMYAILYVQFILVTGTVGAVSFVRNCQGIYLCVQLLSQKLISLMGTIKYIVFVYSYSYLVFCVRTYSLSVTAWSVFC